MKKIIKRIPDVLILCGIRIFSYVNYFPVEWWFGSLNELDKIDVWYDYTNHFKFIAIVLASIWVYTVIRKIIERKDR